MNVLNKELIVQVCDATILIAAQLPVTSNTFTYLLIKPAK